MPLFLFSFQILATKRMPGGCAPLRAQACLWKPALLVTCAHRLVM